MSDKEEKRAISELENEVVKLSVDLPDMVVESYTKSFMAYRISLENWFLLNEILAYIKGEKISSKEIQERLNRLFSVVNSEILREMVKLNKIAQQKAATLESEEKEESEGENSSETESVEEEE